MDDSGILFLLERSELLQECPRGKARGGVRWWGSEWGQVERPGMGSGGWGFRSVFALWFIGQVRLSEPERTQEQEGVLGPLSDNP